MNKLCSTFAALWNKTRSLSPLVPLMLVSLLLALLLGGGNDPVGALSLFQSPPPEPAATPVPIETPVPPPEPTAAPAPTETPVPPSEPAATPLPPEATAAAPAETSPSETPSEGSPPAPAETPPPAEAPEAPEAVEPGPATPEEEEELPPTESPPLIFNWGVFLNTVILILSYAWVCCGVCGLVGTPLTFILLYVGGKRRLSKRLEEDEEDGGES